MDKTIRNLSRERTQHAFEAIQSWERRKRLSEYVKCLKGLPVALRTQGLVQVCAIHLKRDDERAIIDAIARWLVASQLPFFDPMEETPKDGRTLLAWSAKTDNNRYRAAQHEALAFTEQLKLLGEAWDRG